MPGIKTDLTIASLIGIDNSRRIFLYFQLPLQRIVALVNDPASDSDRYEDQRRDTRDQFSWKLVGFNVHVEFCVRKRTLSLRIGVPELCTGPP